MEFSLRILSRYFPHIRFIATAGQPTAPVLYRTLEEYLLANPNIQAHRAWLNYWNNAMGFNDVEFKQEKKEGTLRILALGDSLVYGSVSYPLTAINKLEDILNRDCSHQSIEILNMGVPGTGVWDYKTIYELAAPIFKPDLVLVHFYLGNES